MGKVSISGAGSPGAGSDECSALKEDVLKGMYAITADSEDEVIEGTLELTGDAADSQVLDKKTFYNKDAKVKRAGTMPNRGAVTTALNAGESYAILAGYHNGSGNVIANSLASQTPGNASARHILSGQIAWVNGNKITGSIPYQNAEIDGTDHVLAQNYANWGDGNYFLGVRNGYYLNGVNWVRGYNANFIAANIKKGVNVAGIVGTFEGYVPTVTDLYLRGNNFAGFRSYYWDTRDAPGITFDSGQITVVANSASYTSALAAINTTGFNYVNMEFYINSKPAGVYIALTDVLDGRESEYNTTGFYTRAGYNPGGPQVISLPIGAINKVTYLKVGIYGSNHFIYRIWCS